MPHIAFSVVSCTINFSRLEMEFASIEERTDPEPVHGRADHRDSEGTGGRRKGGPPESEL